MPSAVIPSRPSPDENWYGDDEALRSLVRLHAPKEALAHAESRLEELGRVAPQELDALARAADKNRPVLRRRTPEGDRLEEVVYHPSYERLRSAAREFGVFTSAWHPFGPLPKAPRPLGFALGYLYAQAESGYYCPACMTDGAAFVLARHAPHGVRDRFVPRLISRSVADGFEGAMYLTEKGGGSDVGGGTATVARDAGDGSWRLTGEKWFASNCTADIALALARMPDGAPGTEGLGLFALPRRLPDGEPNPGVRIERLKDKLGVASMATGEILLEEAVAYLVSEPPRGFKAMAEMVNLSRLYNAVASVGIARRALREGERAALHRESFGMPLGRHPLFVRGLLELRIDVQAALAAIMETAAVFDKFAQGDRDAERLLRILTPCLKAMTAKLAVRAASEGCEFLGGVGYVEEYVTPRLLRDAQVLPIWEGTTNVQALEFMKACERGLLDAFERHVRGLADSSRLAAALNRLRDGTVTEASSLRHLRFAYGIWTAALVGRLANRDRSFEANARIIEEMQLGDRVRSERLLEEEATRLATG